MWGVVAGILIASVAGAAIQTYVFDRTTEKAKEKIVGIGDRAEQKRAAESAARYLSAARKLASKGK
jgi:hypothetical protein